MSDKNLFSDIYKVVTRKPIPPGQITLYKVLYEANNEWVSKTELAQKMRDNDEHSLQGVLGALGHRVNKTEGLSTSMSGITLMLETQKNNNKLYYRMRSELRELINQEDKLHDAIILPVKKTREELQDEHKWLVI